MKSCLKTRRIVGFGVVAAATLGVVSSPSAVHAIDAESPDVDATIDAIINAGVDEAEASQPPVNVTDEMTVRADDGSAVVLPEDPADDLELQLVGGESLAVGIPGRSAANDGVAVSDSVVVYGDASADTSVAAVATDEGALQALVTLDGPSAPTSFRFPIVASDEVSLEDAGDGSIDIVGANGVTMAYIAPAWATDAAGAAVPTWYEIQGNVLIQHVDHSSAEYPVVADPWVQGDCGWVTCTIRFSRASTRNARDAAWVIGAAAGACGVIGGPLAIVCAAAVAPAAVVLAVAAGRYYEVGNCLGIRFPKVPATAWPVEVRRGSYNCA